MWPNLCYKVLLIQIYNSNSKLHNLIPLNSSGTKFKLHLSDKTFFTLKLQLYNRTELCNDLEFTNQKCDAGIIFMERAARKLKNLIESVEDNLTQWIF